MTGATHSRQRRVIGVDPEFAATQIIDNLRAMGCRDELGEYILNLCFLKIAEGYLEKQPHGRA